MENLPGESWVLSRRVRCKDIIADSICFEIIGLRPLIHCLLLRVPPFDKAVFEKENKVGSCIGPIQTQFGWHLIWIEDRNFVE